MMRSTGMGTQLRGFVFALQNEIPHMKGRAAAGIAGARTQYICFGKEGMAMAKQAKNVTFTFINPNTPQDFERQFRRILIDKLVAVHRQSAMAN